MKILSAEQIRAADANTIANEPISSLALMERAAQQCTNWLLSKFTKDEQFAIDSTANMVPEHIGRFCGAASYAVECLFENVGDEPCNCKQSTLQIVSRENVKNN